MAIYFTTGRLDQAMTLVTVSHHRPSVFLSSVSGGLTAPSFLKNQIVEKIKSPLLPGAIPSVATQTGDTPRLDAWQGGALSFAYIAASLGVLQAEGASYGWNRGAGEGLPPLLSGGFRREQGRQGRPLGTAPQLQGAGDLKRFFLKGRFASHHQCPTLPASGIVTPRGQDRNCPASALQEWGGSWLDLLANRARPDALKGKGV